MQSAKDNGPIPTSLILTIDSRDNVVCAAINETSFANSDAYLIGEILKYDRRCGYIPDHMIVEYRFPNREAVPQLNPGVNNEPYGRDLYYARDVRDIPRQYIPLRVAYLLTSNNYRMFQSEDVYNRIRQCREYREFEYENNRKKDGHSERRDRNDAEALAAIRAAGGPSLYDMPLVGIWPGAEAEVKHPNPITYIWKTSDLTNKPYPTGRKIVKPELSRAYDPIREAVKEGATTAIKKRYPLMSKRRIRKAIDGIDKQLSSGKKKGFGL